MKQPLSLNTRLFASYLFLLSITFGVIAGVLLLAFRTRPEPDANTYPRLAAVLRELDIDNLATDYFRRNPQSERVTPQGLYQDFAERRDLRLLVANPTTARVFFDSAGIYQQGDPINLTLVNYAPPTVLTQSLPGEIEMVFGRISDGGDGWLFAGAIDRSARLNTWAVMVTEERNARRSLQSALADYAPALAVPLLQAGIFGLGVAFILAAVISRTIARPLYGFAETARAITHGDYSKRAPVEGAPELQAVAHALNQMTQEVHATQKAQRDFLANVSHDLKTPLTSIQGYSQAIMDGTSHDVTRAATIIHEETARLSRMVNDLTDLARLQAGSIPLHRERLDLSALVNAVVERLQVIAERKNITITRAIPPAVHFHGDGDRLVQALTNLISNAVNYTPHGGKEIHVMLECAHDAIRIHIRDHGVGIPLEEQARIFERFYQVDKARGPQRGTGLGLAITHEIVLAHGGNIQVKSGGIDQGATFTVWLPVDGGK